MILPSLPATVNLLPGRFALVADGELYGVYDTHLDAIYKADDLSAVGCEVAVIPVRESY